MISQPSNQQRVISFTLVSQHVSAMWNWQVDRLRTIPSDCWCGQMCVWGCALACIRDRVGYTWCHLAVAPHTEHSPSLCVESEPPGSWIQITAHTNHHQRINTHTHHIKHQCTDASREHTNCSLRLSINLFIYIYIFLLFLSLCFSHHWLFFLHSIYSPSTCPTETPPWGPLRSACRCSEISIKTAEDTKAAWQRCSSKMKTANWWSYQLWL